MQFLISDTFTDSLARLSGDEQKAVKTTAFDLQLNPVNTGMQFHRLDKAKDPNFWSVRVSSDIRLIVHRTEASMLLCFVGHHDNAYHWAERRKLETHPKTGAAQIVELRETVVEIMVPTLVEAKRQPQQLPLLFADMPEDELLGYGVPLEWLKDVRNADEVSLLELGDHLPAEAAEALLAIAVGAKPQSAAGRGLALTPIRATAGAGIGIIGLLPPAAPTPPDMIGGILGTSRIDRNASNPFEHPDAQRRFRLLTNVEELALALDYPWDKWTVFLHPAQRSLVERDYSGPARVSGSAGTGKTIVALHRAVYLARNNPDARVLLTTFSDTLANSLAAKLKRLLSGEPRLGDQIEVLSLIAIGERLYERQFGKPRLADPDHIRNLLIEISKKVPNQKFSQRFLLSEWEDVVDAWQLETWEAYRDVARLGRKTRLPEQHRATLWYIFEELHKRLEADALTTYAGMYTRLAERMAQSHQAPFDYTVIDEAQDVSVAQLRFLAALGGDRPNSLFFAGDLGQRIFQQPFSWKSLGVDVRGRSRTLYVNYRTSHQIRAQADRLLEPQVSDVDGNTEERVGTISVFNGPPPSIRTFDTEETETEAVTEWLKQIISEGVAPQEIGVFVRSDFQLNRANSAVASAGLAFRILDDNVDTQTGYLSISTMHLAKGLEFRAVAVIACDDEVIPLQERIESATDDSDLEEVYNTERHLLYVACTRARDHLLVTAVKPGSEFLEDMGV